MNLDSWKSQMRKGAAEFAVLSALRDGELYGVELVRRLTGADGVGLSEGTVYPLLRRLQADGRLAARWETSDTAPPRKYYSLTPAGRKAADGMLTFWRQFQTQLNAIVRP
ncbi:PadR family transcriptional regulator [Glycocaulis sp.]